MEQSSRCLCGHTEAEHQEPSGCVPCLVERGLMCAYFRPRSEVISEPNAAIRVERVNLTEQEREDLTIDVDLSKIDFSEKANPNASQLEKLHNLLSSEADRLGINTDGAEWSHDQLYQKIVERYETPPKFNEEQYLLTCLAEEASEVAEEACKLVKRATKALRFGLQEIQEGQDKTNLERMVDVINLISYELNDLIAVLEVLNHNDLELLGLNNRSQIAAKKEKLKKYMQLSKERGILQC